MNTVALVDAGDTIRVRIPMKLKKQSGRKVVIVPQGLESAGTSQTNYHGSLMITLARAHLWEELLESGKFGSIKELAETVGLDAAYVARIMRLTLLSPEIVTAIIEGEEPNGLTCRELSKPFPMLWQEQKEMLGFACNG